MVAENIQLFFLTDLERERKREREIDRKKERERQKSKGRDLCIYKYKSKKRFLLKRFYKVMDRIHSSFRIVFFMQIFSGYGDKKDKTEKKRVRLTHGI